MPLTRFDIFTKRGKPPPDVLRENLPQELRVQICGIVDETVAEAGYRDSFPGSVGTVYGRLHYGLAHELGRTTLAGSSSDDRRCVQTFIMGDSPEHVLSLLDVLFQLLGRDAVSAHPQRRHVIVSAAVAAERELNRRFREHGAGYSIENARVVKVTSTHLHKEVVKPALAVLHASDFAGADAEFRRAHEHHRHARHEEAITDCLKALESTLKVICTRRGWPFDDQKDTAGRLIDIVFDQGLVPDQMKSEFSALRAVLESGVPTIRNRSGGHGAGVKPRVVPEPLATYALHLTAATILFLAELEKGR